MTFKGMQDVCDSITEKFFKQKVKEPIILSVFDVVL